MLVRNMLIHIFSASNYPRGIFDMLEQSFAEFLKGASEFGPRFHWIKWSQLCKPYEEGGVGVRSLQHMFDAFL